MIRQLFISVCSFSHQSAISFSVRFLSGICHYYIVLYLLTKSYRPRFLIAMWHGSVAVNWLSYIKSTACSKSRWHWYGYSTLSYMWSRPQFDNARLCSRRVAIILHWTSRATGYLLERNTRDIVNISKVSSSNNINQQPAEEQWLLSCVFKYVHSQEAQPPTCSNFKGLHFN